MTSKSEMRRIAEQCSDGDGNFMLKITKKLRGMSPEEFKQSLIDSGIITKDGKLTSAYRKTEL